MTTIVLLQERPARLDIRVSGNELEKMIWERE
jgi:hypothetical protein